MNFFSDFSWAIIGVFAIIFILYFSNISSKRYITFAVIALSSLAFCVDPINGYNKYGDYIDLVRFFKEMQYFSQGGWNASLPLSATSYETLPVLKCIVYFISVTGIYGLLPMLTCLIGYGLFGKQLSLIKKDYAINEQTVKYIFVLFIALTNYSTLISNIRMPVGLTIFSYILYLDLVKKEKFIKCLIGYILLIGVHSIFIVFLGLRIILYFSNKYSLAYICAVSVFLGVAVNVVDTGFLAISSNPLIASIFQKITYYTRESVAQYEDNLYLLIAYLKVALLLISLFRARKLKLNQTKTEKKLYQYSIIVLSFVFGAIWNFHLFTRMCNFVTYLVLTWAAIFESKGHNATMNSKKIIGSKGKFTPYQLACIAISLCSVVYLCCSHNYRMLHF